MSFTDELVSNYREIRSRLRAPPHRVPVIVESLPPRAAEKPNPIVRDWLHVSGPTKMLQILGEVAREHHVTIEEMRGPSRFKRVVQARKTFCYRAMTETKQPGSQIGKMIHRDRTTVLWSVQSYCKAHKLPLPRGMGVSCREKLERYNGKNA